MDQKVILIREGKIIPAIGQYTNAHSEYLDSLVKHGIVGLLSLLALLLVPLLLFSFRLRSPKLEDHSYALAGVCLCTSYLVFGLTTTFLTLNIGVMMLAFLMVILWSYLHPPQTATT